MYVVRNLGELYKDHYLMQTGDITWVRDINQATVFRGAVRDGRLILEPELIKTQDQVELLPVKVVPLS